MEVEERFWSKVDWYGKGEDECWPWTKGTVYYGYGGFWFVDRPILAHRMAYELTYGDLPEWDTENPILVRHKCDNPPCCNPSHLELGTHADNKWDSVVRGRDGFSTKTECKHRHPFSEANTRWYTKASGRLARACRKCENKKCLAYYYKNKNG